MTLGAKLQSLRKQSGMSQETLAGQLGVSRQAVSRWELDISLLETENIIKLAKIFNVSFDYLLNEEITEFYREKTKKKISDNRYFILILMMIVTGIVAVFLGLRIFIPYLPILANWAITGFDTSSSLVNNMVTTVMGSFTGSFIIRSVSFIMAHKLYNKGK